MKRWNIRIVLAIVLAMVLVAAGCSAAKEAYNGNYAKEDAAYDYEDASSLYNSGNTSDPGASSSFDLANDAGLKIVWTGTVAMESTEWEKTITDLKALFSQYGVQVMASEESGGNRYETSGSIRTSARYLKMELRVPSENFGDFMDGLGKATGSVTNASKSRADLTKQYDSNELSLKLLNEEYEDLSKLMSEAKDLSEIMMIRDRMTEVMKEIRSLTETNNHIDYDVQYSRVTLTLREVVVYSDPEKEDSWIVRLGKSFAEGARNFVDGLGDFVVWLGGNIFQILLLVAIFVVIPIIIIRSCIRKGKKKREAKDAEKKAGEAAKEAKPAENASENAKEA